MLIFRKQIMEEMFLVVEKEDTNSSLKLLDVLNTSVILKQSFIRDESLYHNTLHKSFKALDQRAVWLFEAAKKAERRKKRINSVTTQPPAWRAVCIELISYSTF